MAATLARSDRRAIPMFGIGYRFTEVYEFDGAGYSYRSNLEKDLQSAKWVLYDR
jgi:hypothetical protein